MQKFFLGARENKHTLYSQLVPGVYLIIESLISLRIPGRDIDKITICFSDQSKSDLDCCVLFAPSYRRTRFSIITKSLYFRCSVKRMLSRLNPVPIRDCEYTRLKASSRIRQNMYFWSPEFFQSAGEMLNSDKDLATAFGSLNTTILAECSDRSTSFLIEVGNGRIASREAKLGEKADFKFSAPYHEWARILKDESKIQSEVVKGKIKFSGSMPKLLLYLSKIVKMEGRIIRNVKGMDLQY